MADNPENQPARPDDPNPAAQAGAPGAPPTQRLCGTMPVHERLLRTDPGYARARIASENNHHMMMMGQRAPARAGITSIPVVVHVVFNTAQQNISDAQVKSQIDVLNRDFRKTNPDVALVPAAFAPLVADARVQFTLATTGPNGAVTNGITRTPTNKASFTDDDQIKSAATGGADAWPADKYLNLWTAPRLTSPQGDLLGYAQFPGGPAATDGVVILHSAFGTSGTAAAPFNLGRTATHEIGHWLNLRHIWGDDGNGCNGSDFVADTPNQANHNFGTPAFPHVTCNNGPNGDLFMNYMDYTDDVGMFMFTAGQVDRMQASLDSDRSTIGTTVPGPTSPQADLGTLKFREDNPPSLKFNDDGTLKFREDNPPSLKFNDDGTLKFREDNPPSLNFRDDAGSIKILDDGIPQPPGPFNPGLFGPGPQGAGGPRQSPAAPFVLSTPHHSTAWMQTYPQAAQQALAMAEQQIRQYEEALNAYAQADAAGQLGPEDRQQAEGLFQEYLALVAEYRQLTGR